MYRRRLKESLGQVLAGLEHMYYSTMPRFSLLDLLHFTLVLVLCYLCTSNVFDAGGLWRTILGSGEKANYRNLHQQGLDVFSTGGPVGTRGERIK